MDTIRTESESAAAGDVPVSSSHEKHEMFTSEPTVDTVKDEAADTIVSTKNPQPEMDKPETASEEVDNTNILETKPPSKPESKEAEITANADLQSGILFTENTIGKDHPANCSTDRVQSVEHSAKEVPTTKHSVDEIHSMDHSSVPDAKAEHADQVEKQESSVVPEEQMDTTENNEEETPRTPPPSKEASELSTPKGQRCASETESETCIIPTSAATTGVRGRKRKVVEEDATASLAKTPKTPGRPRVHTAKVKLLYTDYVSSKVGDRVLSCGEGEQLGHPGRTTTKKPRKVDIVEDEGLKIVQVVAGGVHSALLTVDGDVYMCGINEQGTVPAIGVEAEGSTDKFAKIELTSEIRSQGKIVMLAAGASFTAALTDKGSVIAWGNLRDTSGEINVHPLLAKMKDHPVVLIHHKKRVIVKIAAGENHLVMLEEDGRVLTFGDGKMGQLGRSKRIGSIRPQYMVDEDGRSLVLILQDKRRKDIPVKDIHAGGFWTMLITDDQVFSFGLNNFEHLGIPIKEEAPADASTEDKRELRVFTPSVASAYLGRIWTHIDGVQHIIARDANGEVFGIGKNTDNALGLGTWTGNDDSEHWKYSTLERVQFPTEAGKIAGTTAKLGCSIAWTEDGEAYAWGCDTSGQLGLGLKDDDDRVVPKPQRITSAHLEGYKIISVSISDNHSLFLATKK